MSLDAEVGGHGIGAALAGGRVWVRLRGRCQSFANWVLFDVSRTGFEFVLGQDLGFVEAVSPDVLFALEAEGETAFDELHGLLKRNVGGRGDEGVDVIGHDDPRVEEVLALAAVVEEGLLEEGGGGGGLEERATPCGDGCDEVGACFLGCGVHVWRIGGCGGWGSVWMT